MKTAENDLPDECETILRELVLDYPEIMQDGVIRDWVVARNIVLVLQKRLRSSPETVHAYHVEDWGK